VHVGRAASGFGESLASGSDTRRLWEFGRSPGKAGQLTLQRRRARLVRLPADALDFVAMVEIVTPNEIANALGVTGLRFRNWLRDQKAAGHPLLAHHEYRTPYEFTPAEADQLTAEFIAHVLDRRGPRPRMVRTRADPTTTNRPTAGKSLGAASAVEYAPSDDPGHRVVMEWMGAQVETLADLLRPGLLAVAVGINPAPISVAAGHYYQGNYGQRLFTRLRKVGLLPDGDGWEDDRAFAAGVGFTDVVKRPTPGEKGLRPGELEHGRSLLEAKLTKLDVPLVIFVFKSAADTLLGRLPPYFYGLVPRRRLGPTRAFVMPGPTAPSEHETNAVAQLRKAV
jgi:TDG/mug DNA glycosylase family protein